MNNYEIEISISDSISTEMESVTIDYMEATIDHFLNDENLKELPFIKSVNTIYKSIVSLRDRRFIVDVLNFFNYLNYSSHYERVKFVREHLFNPQEKEHFGRLISTCLEKSNSSRKPKLLADICRYCIEGKCSYSEVKKLIFIVDNVYYDDLQYLKRFTTGFFNEDSSEYYFHNLGLLKKIGEDLNGNGDLSGISYELTKYGLILKEILQN